MQKVKRKILDVPSIKKPLELCLLTLAFCLLTSSSALPSSDTYSQYVRGLMAERAGDLKTALKEYQKVVAEDPRALEVFKDIAQLSLRTGRTEDALRAAEHAKDLAPDDPESHLFLGDVYVARGDLSKAVQEFEKTLQLDPENLRAMENLGNYYSAFDVNRALEYYNKYLVLSPREAEIYFQIGFLYEKNNNIDKAIEAFKKSAELDPSEVAPHLALAEIYESQKSTEAAIAEYQKCVQLDPHNPTFEARLGHLYFQTERWDEAYGAFQKAAALEPRDGAIYYWLARIAEERHQWAEAENDSRKAYDLSRDPQFLPLLAYYLTVEGKPKEAISWLQKARKTDPTNPNVILFLGMDYLDLDKPKKALPILEAGAAQQPKDAQMQFQLGVAYDRLGQFDKAVAQFEKVLVLDPDNAPALNYLGYSFADRSMRLPEAETMLRRAVKLEPDNGAYLDSLGWVLYKRGDPAQAAATLEQAIAQSPDPQIYEHLGDAYNANHQVDKALEAWNKALALSKNNPGLQKKIQEASQHIVPASDPRHYLQGAEGNFHQITNLQGTASVKGQWQKQAFKTKGGLYYLSPDRLLLAVGTPKNPELRVAVRKQKIVILPDEAAQFYRGFSFEHLTWLTNYFSGTLLDPLDVASVKVDTTTDNQIHFTGPSDEAWIDLSRGVLTRYVRTNPDGGQDTLTIKSYALIDGVWLPTELQINNPREGWKADLTFSSWRVNQPQTARTYETLMSETPAEPSADPDARPR